MNFFRHGLVLLALLPPLSFEGSVLADTSPETTILWTLQFPGGFNSSKSTPAVADDGTVYLGTFYGLFLAITPNGGIKWKYDINAEIKSSPAIADDGTIYFGSRNRNFYALNPDGKLKWKFPTGDWVDSSPAIARDGTVYFGSADKTFYALNPDGSIKWKFPVGAIVDSSPAVATDGTVYFGAHDKKFYALTPNGVVRWAYLTGGEIISSPAIGSDGTVYFSSLDGNLYALTANGKESWHYRTGSTRDSSPVLDESGNLYLRVNSSVISVSPEGAKRWDQGTPLWLDETPAVIGDRICCSLTWRKFGALTSDHQWIWTCDLGQSDNVTASPVVSPDGIIYACTELYLQSLRPPGIVSVTVKSSWPMFRANAHHTGRVGNSHISN